MKNKWLKYITNNIGYKILALAFAFVLWFMVYNMEDPVKTKTITVNVTLTNATYLENLEKYYEITEGTNRVNIAVSAPRSILDNLDETDFTAIANLNNIVINEDGTKGTVPIEVSCKEDSDSISMNILTKSCKIALENLMSKQFVISASAVGKVAEGHALGDVEVTAPTVLKVSGPESIIKSISAILAPIDVGDMSMSLTDNVVPVLLDGEGNEINTTRLTLSNETVTVSAEILKKKDVPIRVTVTGTPAEGYVLTKPVILPETIGIKGNSAILNGVTSIDIPSELMNVSGATEDLKFEIDITDYLPEGTELVDVNQATVEIILPVEAIKNKSLHVDTKDIKVEGLAEGLQLYFATETETIVISGLKDDLDKLTKNNLDLSIDVTDLEEGTHQVDLILGIDDKLYTYQTISIAVEIIAGQDDTENTESTQEPQSLEAAEDVTVTE
jgi:YbbR domain-containing protein